MTDPQQLAAKLNAAERSVLTDRYAGLHITALNFAFGRLVEQGFLFADTGKRTELGEALKRILESEQR